MDQGRAQPRVHFRGLEVVCSKCKYPVPYNPRKLIHYCLDCDPKRAAINSKAVSSTPVSSNPANSTAATSTPANSKTSTTRSISNHAPSFEIMEVPCHGCKRSAVSCDPKKSVLLCNRCQQLRTKSESEAKRGSERGNHAKGRAMKQPQEFGTSAFTSRERPCRGCNVAVPYDPNITLSLCEQCLLTRTTFDTKPAGSVPTTERSSQRVNTFASQAQRERKMNHALEMNSAGAKRAGAKRPAAISEAVAKHATKNMNYEPEASMKDGMGADSEEEFVHAKESFSSPRYYDANTVMEYRHDQRMDRTGPEEPARHFYPGEHAELFDPSAEYQLSNHRTSAEQEEDLFTSTFGGNDVNARENDERSDASGDVVMGGGVFQPKPAAKGKGKTAPAKTSKPAKHGPKANKAGAWSGTGPNPVSDLSPSLRYLRDFHSRAKVLIPRLPLAEGRYWIGVLHVGRRPAGFSQEKHFTWMKGNRRTTVSTVWHSYQSATATDGFVLLLGLERVRFTDRAEELDYFNDKKIMFRAVEEGHADAKGREMCEGVVPKERAEAEPEVIELD